MNSLQDFSTRHRLTFLSLASALVYWLADAATVTLFDPSRTFLAHLFLPDRYHLGIRVITLLIFFFYGGYAARLVRSLRRARAKLREGEYQLTRSEVKYRSIFNTSNDAILIHDTETATIIEANLRALSLFGYESSEIGSIALSSLCEDSAPEGPDRLEDLVRRAASGRMVRQTWRMRHREGTPFWADLTMKRIILDEKIRLMCVVSDISERVSLARFPAENPFPVLRVSADQKMLYANAGAKTLLESWDGDLPVEIKSGVSDALAAGNIIDTDLTVGSRVYGLSCIPVVKEQYVNVYGRDITERRRAEQELRLAAEVFDTAGEGIFVTDPKGTILDVNNALCQITGYSREEVIGQNPSMMRSDRHDRSFYTDMWRSIQNDGFWQGEVWDRRKTGEAYPKWLTINTVYDEDGQISHYVASFSDITEVKAKQERIEYLAHYDGLTGLPNRTLFHERLSRGIADSRRVGYPLALLFVDLDRFKEINDTMGHPAGDELLRQVARRLTGLIRESDTVSRLGGDEFTVILPHLSGSEDAARVAKKILASCSEPFDLMGQTVYLTASVGITLCPEDSAEMDVLIRNADTAMYHSKESGRDRFQFFSPEMNVAAQRRLDLEMRLRRALEAKEFHLVYQPKLDIQNRRYCGSEALIRWTSADIGPVSPGDFIPLAEETNLIHPIGTWVIKEVCRQIASRPILGERRLPVSVNVAPVQFDQPGFVRELLAILSDHEVDPELLQIEITESALSKGADRNMRALTELRDHGIRVLLDDFGTGYSSLARLKDLPLDILKIDQSFVREIPGDGSANAVAASIIHLAHNLQMRVIAEGVETNEQLEFMREHHCDEIQGYLCCAPVSMEELIEQVR